MRAMCVYGLAAALTPYLFLYILLSSLQIGSSINIALYHWNTIYCFIALDHQFIMCTNQLLSYFHLISANWITIRYCFQGLYIRISNAVHFYFHIFN